LIGSHFAAPHPEYLSESSIHYTPIFTGAGYKSSDGGLHEHIFKISLRARWKLSNTTILYLEILSELISILISVLGIIPHFKENVLF
jgi:hypothetical protein